MNVSREVYDYDRTFRQRYHENPCPYDIHPNLSEKELISDRTQTALREKLSLLQIPSDRHISLFVRKWMKDETTRALFDVTKGVSSWAIQTEGSIGRTTGEFLVTSRQQEWGTKELMLTAAGIAFVLKAVEIEPGMLHLEDLDTVDEDVLRKAGQKVGLPSDYYPENAIKNNAFSVFPEGQTRMIGIFSELEDAVCDNDRERLAFELGATGMYYMLEAGEETLRKQQIV